MKTFKVYKLQLATLGMIGVSLAACSSDNGLTASTPTLTLTSMFTPTQSTDMPTPTQQPTDMLTPTQSTDPNKPTPSIIVGEAPISNLDVLIMESFPVQVSVVVKGQFPDSCTTIGKTAQTRNDNIFTVTVASERPADAMCAQVMTPFKQAIPLDVTGLKAGTYTVNVNGVTETFELQQDNSPIP